MVSALPNIYDLAQLDDFVGASQTADITAEEAARIEALYDSNYGGLPPDEEVDPRQLLERLEASA